MKMSLKKATALLFLVVFGPPLAGAKLLSEQPDIRDVSLPGMPSGSPGIPGEQQSPFMVRTLSNHVYAAF
ncbi:MAG: DUF411 domain-containing protein [Salinisphaera sp.]|uniref:hypothetical protein n=1 Tax=Salinisphaera sp. TaxID=1914330 RepID=UPI003C7C1620